MELEKVENRRFGPGEKVELDGKSFVNCAFDGCEVVYGGQDKDQRLPLQMASKMANRA
jgi:hypothetical protein